MGRRRGQRAEPSRGVVGGVRGHPVRSGGGGGGPSSILHVCKYPGEGADAVTVGCHGAGAPRTRRGELRAQGWTPGAAARPVLLNRAAGPSVKGRTRRRGRGAGGGDAGPAEGTRGGRRARGVQRRRRGAGARSASLPRSELRGPRRMAHRGREGSPAEPEQRGGRRGSCQGPQRPRPGEVRVSGSLGGSRLWLWR